MHIHRRLELTILQEKNKGKKTYIAIMLNFWKITL